MVYPKQRNTSYTGISGRERHLLEALSEAGIIVFGVNIISRLSSWESGSVNNTLFSLRKKGLVTRLRRDVYARREDVGERLYAVVSQAYAPCYISFWTALSLYGYTTQQVKAVQLVSPRQWRKTVLGNTTVETTALRPDRFYGYLRTDGYSIAEKEKALIDSLYLPRNAGGFTEVASCMSRAAQDIDPEKFARYLERFGDRSLTSRAGYLMERFGNTLPVAEKNRSKGYVRLDPSKPASREYDRSWRVNVNVKDVGGDTLR